MFKLTLAAMAAALLTPALAHGATIRGAVVAKQANRHVLVVASPRGAVTSARVTPRQLRQAQIGARLILKGKRLADGTLQVTGMRRLGHLRRARVNVVVMKAKPRRLLVAGGGSAFSIRLTRSTRVLASAGAPQPGQEIETEIQLSDGTAVGQTIQATGQAPLIDFSGAVTAIDASSFTVSSDGVPTVVQLPNGVVLPPLVQIGSEVEVVASISGSTLTLATIRLDGESSGDNGGSNVDNQGQMRAEGFVTALDATSITVQPGDNASPVTFAVPAGFTLPSGLAVGSVVEADGAMVSGTMTLTRIELQNDGAGQGELEAEGAVTALDATSITIQTEDGGSPITFTIPNGFALPAGLAVGSYVDAQGTMLNGVATLAQIEVKSADGAQVEAGGSVTALDASTITIQGGDNPTPVTFTIPTGFTLPSGLAVGSMVDAQGQYANGVLTLSQIEIQSDTSS